MEGSVGAPPQRVCPNCARISWATGPQCPYCAGRFRQRKVTPWMLAVTAASVVVVVALMFLFAGRELDRRLDSRVDNVQKQFDASLNKFRDDVRKELDARGGATGGTGGIATPFPTATAFPTPTVDPGVTPTPTAEPTTSPDATETPTATIQP
jgi:hypothetical protein